MSDYNSALFGSLFANDSIDTSGLSTVHIKENLLGGSSIVDSNGNLLLDTMPSAMGGETITLANGETAQVVDNIYGGTSIDFVGTSNDIIGRPSLFGESFTQNGAHIGTLEPNFTGTGFDFTSPTGETLISTSPGLFGETQLNFHSSFGSEFGGEAFNLHNSFGDVDAITSQFDAVDLASTADALDGLDMLGFF